jgi:hypothetical protein
LAKAIDHKQLGRNLEPGGDIFIVETGYEETQSSGIAKTGVVDFKPAPFFYFEVRIFTGEIFQCPHRLVSELGPLNLGARYKMLFYIRSSL